MKKKMIILALSLACILQGCSYSGKADRETLELKKNGSVVETVRESFDKEYYNIEDLKSYITSAVAEYNEDFSEAHIVMEKCGKPGTYVEAVLNYKSVDDYKKFNNVEIFSGSISELENTDYHVALDLKDMQGAVVSLSHVLASGEDYKAAIITQSCELKVSGRIVYYSEGVKVLSGKTADININDEACAYIIYQ